MVCSRRFFRQPPARAKLKWGFIAPASPLGGCESFTERQEGSGAAEGKLVAQLGAGSGPRGGHRGG